MMRILHITSSFMPPKIEGDLSHSHIINNNEGTYSGARIGGISAIVEAMNKHLPDLEHHVLLSQGQRFNSGRWEGRKIVEERDGLFIHYFPNMGDITDLESAQYTFKGILEDSYEDFSFDIVLTHVVNPDLLLEDIDKKVRWVNFTHGSPSNSDLSDAHMELIDVNVVFSQWLKTRLKDNSKSVIIPFPVDTDMFCPRDGTLQGDFVWHGRIAPEKRILPFAARFATDMMNKELTIVGGPDNTHCRFAMSAIQSPNVHFKGRMFDENLASILSAHPYYVFMSEYECAPVAFVEALASGCSVYAIRHPSMEWAEDYVYFVDDMDGLFEAIQTAKPQPNAVDWIEKNNSWNALKDAYMRVLVGPNLFIPVPTDRDLVSE